MSEPFSKSIQKRIESQTGQKLYTQAELDAAIAAAVAEIARVHARISNGDCSCGWFPDRLSTEAHTWDKQYELHLLSLSNTKALEQIKRNAISAMLKPCGIKPFTEDGDTQWELIAEPHPLYFSAPEDAVAKFVEMMDRDLAIAAADARLEEAKLWLKAIVSAPLCGVTPQRIIEWQQARIATLQAEAEKARE